MFWVSDESNNNKRKPVTRQRKKMMSEPIPTPEEFDTAFPEFQESEYLHDMPEMKQPFFDEAARRVYEFRLYRIASGREEARPEARRWAQLGWQAIESGSEVEFTKELAARIAEFVAQEKRLVVVQLLDVMLWVPLRLTQNTKLIELRSELILEKVGLYDGGTMKDVVELVDAIASGVASDEDNIL
jgi:hypothetical protein